ncbi:hypothetical protein KVG96_10175 [Pseudomonas sp. COR58]|uniref:Uncharacterized protein n=1 Tax=Pseudomonas ekonensis TaxID=2842353 RepID=A0ABS6PCX1_9PSED|nr:hypothetical protein [Pseudomonas ekonensis]MBV4458316.1 hypothetical protein [Pseudomonas ekonensis]
MVVILDRFPEQRGMTGIIHQEVIDKKRKKCAITIESVDAIEPRNGLIQPSIRRLTP